MKPPEKKRAGRTGRSSVNLVETVYGKLKAMAITYQFQPGERLTELDLAARLQVSRTPVREALNRLVSEGLLAFSPKRGFQSRPLDAKEVFDLYEVRVSLEVTAVQLAAERASDEDLADLAKFGERSRAASLKTSVVQLVMLDEEFHERIAQLSRNNELLKFLQNINMRIRFCRWIDMEGGRRSKTQTEHALITEALQERDAARCKEVMSNHIHRRLDQIVDVIREGYARIYMGEMSPRESVVELHSASRSSKG